MDQSNIFHQLEIFRMVYGMRIKLLLPSEKPNKTIERLVISFRRVLDGMVFYTF
jgi:hypothetical protein